VHSKYCWSYSIFTYVGTDMENMFGIPYIHTGFYRGLYIGKYLLPWGGGHQPMSFGEKNMKR
jgi:hypothetical protein